jgi:hypothetical protein
MICIKCINPKCTATEGKFAWDDRAHAEGGPAQPGEHGAVAFIVECSYCGTENKVWLKKVKKNDGVVRGV